MNAGSMTYKRSGVDTVKADRLVDHIQRIAKTTMRGGVVEGIGGFAAVFDPGRNLRRGSYLAACTDGVGTKIELARLRNDHRTIGIDLVAMSVNDLITVGAEPLFFLDYYAMGNLRPLEARQVLQGIVRGCRQSDCALIGGETAEMPGVYTNGKYDLAGFAVGILNRKSFIRPEYVRPGDVLLGIASSGVHSNGFSLVRKVFTQRELKGNLGQKLLVPTRIYVKAIRNLKKRVRVKGLAHITGGGITENVPRVLPRGLGVSVERGSWAIPEVFRAIQRASRISDKEMFRTFNMGIGMAVILRSSDAAPAGAVLRHAGLKSWIIGHVRKGEGVVIQ